MRKKSGFSLMEMMIVLLITAVVAAATAPIVSKKMVSSAGGDSPWMWAGTNRAIVYNVGGAAKQTVNIGDIYNGNENPRLYIASKGEIPHIKFANGNSSVNFKVNNEAIGITDGSINNGSVVIGFGTSSDTNDVVIGKGAQTNSQAAVAIGPSANALGANRGVAVGYKAGVTGANGTAIGYDSTASANGSAFGYKATAGTNSLSLGANSNASGTDALAIGYGAQAMKEGCVAIVTGGSGGAKEDFSTAYGYMANAAGRASVAIGDEATAGEDSVCIGSEADATNKAVAIGGGGDETLASDNSVAVGYDARASAENSLAIGYKSKAYAANSIALGKDAYAKGISNIAIGYGATTKYGSGSAANAIAIGNGAIAGYTNSVAIGAGAKANNPNQIVLGDANTTVYIPGRLVVDKGTVLGRTSTEPVYARMHEKSDGNWYSLKVLRYDNGLQDGTDAQGYNHGMLGGYFYDNNYTNSSYPSGDKAKWSDRRLKNVGDAFKGGLAELKKLELFNFTFKKDPNKTPMVGVMAQDLQKVFPNAVFKGEDGFLRIRWDEMFFSMINAIKELDLKITGHDKKLEELQKQNTELQKHIDKLEQRLDKLEKAGKKVK